MGDGDRGRARQERLKGVLEAFRSCQLDGVRPTRNAVRDGWDYIKGRRCLDVIIDDVRRRHTRNPEGGP